MLRRFAVAVSFVACAGVASAQDSPRVEIGATAGWALSDGVSFDPLRAGDGNVYDTIEPSDGFVWGLNLGFLVNPNVEVGALFDRQSSTLDVLGTNTRTIGDMNVDNYHGYVAYNFGDEDARVRPYVLAGAGMTRYNGVSYSVGNVTGETEGTSKFSSTWGAGLKFHPSPRLGVKLGMRWTPVYIKSDATGWWCDPYWGCYVVGDAQYSNQFQFGGGLTLRF